MGQSPFPPLAYRIQDAIRDYLGTAHLNRQVRRALHHLTEQGTTMATITEALTRLAEQVNAVSAAQATSFANLQSAVGALKRGDLSEDQQAAVDQIEASLLTMGEDAQRADDDVEPEVPADPTDGDPTEPTPDVLDDATGEIPGDTTGRRTR